MLGSERLHEDLNRPAVRVGFAALQAFTAYIALEVLPPTVPDKVIGIGSAVTAVLNLASVVMPRIFRGQEQEND